MAVKHLSFYDLMKLPDFKQATKWGNTIVTDKILFNLGIDVAKGYEIETVLHRPLSSNAPWHGPRVEGIERTDREYMESGYASLDCYVENTTDKSLKSELKSLNPSSAREYDEDYNCKVNINLIAGEGS